MSQNHRSAFVPAWLNQAGLPQSEFRIYCCLNAHANKETMTAWPKADTLAAECLMARNTVWRSLKALESKGLIRRVGKPFQGSTRYQILTPTSANGTPIEHPLTGANQIPIEASPTSANETPPTGANQILQPAQMRRREGTSTNVHQGRKDGHASPKIEPPFQSQDFRQAWSEWVQHRKELRKPITATSTQSQFRAFVEWGEQRSIQAIRHSIRSGWQGIFEPAKQTTSSGPHRGLRAEDVSI